ncbi:MAG TPA: maltose ABC transporter substrate-binding protein [Candidatus Limnocylindrales bacterium]|nr:maltose ABC transporter substrate-binding protein [Candidatus Limnocylindrales bacterium]
MKLTGVVVALVLLIAACGGGGATSRPSTATSAAPSTAASAAPSQATSAEPSAEPSEASPTEALPSEEAPTEEAPTEEPPSADPGASPSPTPPPAAEEGTLTLWVDETRFPVVEALGAEFTAATDVPVAVYQVGFGDIRDRLQLYGPTGEGPDIVIGAHDWLGQLASNGLVEPLDLSAVSDDIDPTALAAFTYDTGEGGQVYGLPYAAEAIALYYNPELVPTPPTTWDELIQMATDLQADGGLDQAFVLQEKDPYHSYPLLTANGGYIFGKNDDGTYDPTDVGLDSEGGLAYGQMLSDMVEADLLRAGVNYDTMIQLFTTGESAMFMTGPWALTQIRDSGAPYAVAPIPSGSEDARPFVGVQGFMVSAFAPNKTTAMSFLTEYVATTETMQSLFDADPRPSTWTPVAAATDDEDVQAFITSAANGDPLPAIPEMSAVWTDWTDALDLIFTGAQDSDSALQDAAESIRGIIETGQ